MKNARALLLVLTSPLVGGAASADTLPDYIRYAENRKGARLEVATRSFTLPSGQNVDLVGAVHIADAAYYQELNRRFPAYDAVLFELIGDPSAITQRAPSPSEASGGGMSPLLTAARHLRLVYQLDAIDYTGRNMVHADAMPEQFARMQYERGENLLTLFARAMQAQMSAPASHVAMREFDTLGLLRILLSPDSAAEFKKSLARVFDQMESMTAAMEGTQGSAVLTGRNDLVMRKLEDVLAKRSRRRVAVFYGAAHLPGLETALIRDLGATVTGDEWLVAWRMPARVTKPRADKNPAPGTAKPAS